MQSDLQERGDKEKIRELSWKISASSTVVSVFFVTLIAFYLSNFGLRSIFLAAFCSIISYFALKKSRILKEFRN